jgi:ABC-type sugar transport system permease subunit
MSQPPPGWQPEPHLASAPHSAEAARPAGAATTFTAYDAPAAAAGLNQFASASDPTLGASARRTLTQRNSTTFTAIFVVALYLVLAATTGVVLIGIFPAMLAFRAFQRREPLAALAVAAAAVAIVFSLTVLTRH